MTFTRRPGSNDWLGLSLTGSGANGSLIRDCIISYARRPVRAENVSSLTINLTTINNSSFESDSADAALTFYNSSPTVSSVTITGQWNSWNGVRLTGGSTGSISDCTIQNLGAGNGMVIQGGSSPVITNNSILNNYFHGIVIATNAGGTPVIIDNTLTGNGYTTDSPLYNGIYFIQSSGRIGSNIVQQSNTALWCDQGSSPTTWWTGPYSASTGGNTFSNNYRGVVASSSSFPVVGTVDEFHGELVYHGHCNNILNNTNANAIAGQSSVITAEGNWWGQAPPDPSKIVKDQGSNIHYGYWGTPAQHCPGGGLEATMNNPSTPELQGVAQSLEGDPQIARLKGNFSASRDGYLAILNDDAKTDSEHRRALVGLYEVYRDSKDQTTFDALVGFRSDERFSKLAGELTMMSHLVKGL